MPVAAPLLDAASADRRRAHGQYFTPAGLVAAVVSLAREHLPAPATVVDPACGDGAFLLEATRAFPAATVVGLELDATHAREARARVPGARVLEGDALRGGWDRLLAALPARGPELWLGNPPYNGTSPLLADASSYRALRARLALDATLPRGTSLRDDQAFFLLLAAERLARADGVLAWVTSATVLDAFLYASLRARLLATLRLLEVVELGSGAFPGTRVRTCITVWRGGPRRGTASTASPARHRAWPRAEGALPRRSSPLVPAAPEWVLRPPDAEAERLDARWRARGEALDVLVPFSTPGLKTRFDALLVDDDRETLLARVDDFLRARDLAAFARRHGLDARLVPKLTALRASASLPARADPACVRAFHPWAGARHRGALPPGLARVCYLDRRLIPRGDHRLVGAFDPHACPEKLLFTIRELPLAAAVLTAPGCVPAHRHARFAPLHVPARVLVEGAAAGRRAGELGSPVLNLSPAGRAWAERVGGPLAAFRRIAEFVNSDAVQRHWAPAFGTRRTLPIPFQDLDGACSAGAGSTSLDP